MGRVGLKRTEQLGTSLRSELPLFLYFSLTVVFITPKTYTLSLSFNFFHQTDAHTLFLFFMLVSAVLLLTCIACLFEYNIMVSASKVKLDITFTFIHLADAFIQSDL